MSHLKRDTVKAGAFFTVAPTLAALGVPAIPTKRDIPNKPMVKNAERIQLNTVAALLEQSRFLNANAAFVCGPTSGLSVVDIDSADPVQAEAVIELFGDTPLKVRTPSGGMHCYYQHAGERRLAKVFGANVPIDILGNGLAILPPSIRPERPDKIGGVYTLLEGGLDDIKRLPVMKDPVARKSHADPVSGGTVASEGRRNQTLFNEAIQRCANLPDFDALLCTLIDVNAAYLPPLPSNEVISIAQMVWIYRERGTLWGGGEARAIVPISFIDLIGGNSDALMLLVKVQTGFGHRLDRPFPMAKGLADKLGWTYHRFRKARESLTEISVWECVHPGGNGPGDPPLYSLTPKGCRILPLSNKPPPPLVSDSLSGEDIGQEENPRKTHSRDYGQTVTCAGRSE